MGGRGCRRRVREQIAGIQDPARIEAVHQATNDVDPDPELVRQPWRLGPADPVVMREGAAGVDGGLERGAPGPVVGRFARFLPSPTAGVLRGRAPGEREVDAAAVRVGMTEVRHDEYVSAQCASHRLVEPAELGPLRGDLQGVDERAVREHRRLAVAHRVAVHEPSSCGGVALPATALGFDDPPRLFHAAVVSRAVRVRRAVRARRFVEDDQEHRPAERAGRHVRLQEVVDPLGSLQERAQRRSAVSRRWFSRAFVGGTDGTAFRHHRVERIVETSDGGTEARLEERPHRVPTVLGRRKRPGAEAARGRRGMKPELGARDYGQRPLASHDQRDEIGPHRAPAELDDLPATRHAFERDDHVLDLSVSSGALPRAPGREPSAHRAA